MTFSLLALSNGPCLQHSSSGTFVWQRDVYSPVCVNPEVCQELFVEDFGIF